MNKETIKRLISRLKCSTCIFLIVIVLMMLFPATSYGVVVAKPVVVPKTTVSKSTASKATTLKPAQIRQNMIKNNGFADTCKNINAAPKITPQDKNNPRLFNNNNNEVFNYPWYFYYNPAMLYMISTDNDDKKEDKE